MSYPLYYISSGIAGMCSKTSVAPLTRIKILLQAHNVHYKHLGKEYYTFSRCITFFYFIESV